MPQPANVLGRSLALLGGALPLLSCTADRTPPRPNIVFILADDLGYGDLSCYGQRLFETPNIDAMAAEGMRFTQFYSGTSVSAPSRSCLLTGLHSGHTPVRGNAEVGPEGQFPLPAGTGTFFRDLRDAGYRTAAFGKWGLGGIGTTGDPLAQGLEEFFGFNCQRLAHSYYPDHLWDGDGRVELEENYDTHPYGSGTYAPDIIHRRSLEYLEKAARSGEPFFMWYPTTIPHAELIVPEDSIVRSLRGRFEEVPYKGTEPGQRGWRDGGYCSQEHPRAVFAAMVRRLDAYVGEIVAKLVELGVYDDTMIVFASDNGPHLEGGADPGFFDSNGPFRGYKRDLYEGGIRVPMIVVWKGHTRPGTVSTQAGAFWDLLPTFREAAGLAASPERGCDGTSLLPVLEGRVPDSVPLHDHLYFEFQENGGTQAVRRGDHKLLRLGASTPSPRLELYDLGADPGETTDISASRPDLVRELEALLDSCHLPSADFPLLPGERAEGK